MSVLPIRFAADSYTDPSGEVCLERVISKLASDDGRSTLILSGEFVETQTAMIACGDCNTLFVKTIIGTYQVGSSEVWADGYIDGTVGYYDQEQSEIELVDPVNFTSGVTVVDLSVYGPSYVALNLRTAHGTLTSVGYALD